jgi:hypothetical protein
MALDAWHQTVRMVPFPDTRREPCSLHASFHVVQESTKSNGIPHINLEGGMLKTLVKAHHVELSLQNIVARG